jgi:BirA family biotin operon repressor/biotin-[acetyl-CoA-carboxylase] ligase
MLESLPVDIQTKIQQERHRLDIFARCLHYRSIVTSTNDVAARLAMAGAEEGTAVLADAQTAGRGRYGRVWHSPPDAGLYFSIVLNSPQLPYLTLMAGVAVADAVRRSTGLAVDIKWPNDIVVVSGPSKRWRKLAGILAETTRVGASAERTILGIGINLRHVERPPDLALRASSLEEELARPVDRATVLVESLASLVEWHQRLIGGDIGAILSRWRALAPSACGARVAWTAQSECEGMTTGIDEQGALLVRTDRGEIERILGGIVTWLDD